MIDLNLNRFGRARPEAARVVLDRPCSCIRRYPGMAVLALTLLLSPGVSAAQPLASDPESAVEQEQEETPARSFLSAGQDGPGSLRHLEPVRIAGEAVSYEQYQATEITGALGMPADPMDVPLAVTTITPQALEDIGARRMDDALDFVSGVARQNEFGGLWDNYSIRGFSGDINRGPVFLRDGVRANRGYTGKQDAANLERVEVLKGPSSALVGRTDPGGTVNIVTKRPKFQPEAKVSFSASDEQPYRALLDVTGPLHDGVAGRLNLALEDGDSFRDVVEEKRYLIAPALTWEIGPTTRFHYDGEFVRQERLLDRGVVAIGGDPKVLSVTRFLGEPDDGPIKLETIANRFRLQQDLGTDWSAQLTLAHIHSTMKGYSSEAFGASVEAQQAAGVPAGMLARERRHRDYESDDIVGVAELRGRLNLAAMRHDLLFGAEVSDYSQDFDMRRSRPYSGNPEDLYLIDIYNPVYGTTPPAFVEGRRIYRKDTEETLAFYAQDMIHLLPRLRLLVGGRFDHFRQSAENRLSGAKVRQTDKAVNPRFGLSFDLVPDSLTLYANTARSFDPNSGMDRQGRAFDPERATSYEFGAKSLFFDGRLAVNLALFHIEKKNVLTADPVDSAYSITAGKVTSRGVEVDVQASLTERWRASLSYSYIDAEIQADGVTFQEDARLLNVPEHSASLLTHYEMPLPRGGALGLGGGLVYVGKRVGNQQNPDFKLPAYTTVQTRLYYRPVHNLTLSLQVLNLFNERYYRSSYWENWVAPGAPRTIVGQVEYHF